MSRIGQLITQHTERDAIHVAIAPVSAGVDLKPGQRIKLNHHKQAIPATRDDYIGIVDPWLRTKVCAGQWFWILLNPNTITALRHYWNHPDFPELQANEEQQAALEWMQHFIDQMGSDPQGEEMTIERLLHAADHWLQEGDGTRWGYDTDYIDDEFWKYYEVIRNTTVPANKRDNFFHCNC